MLPLLNSTGVYAADQYVSGDRGAHLSTNKFVSEDYHLLKRRVMRKKNVNANHSAVRYNANSAEDARNSNSVDMLSS